MHESSSVRIRCRRALGPTALAAIAVAALATAAPASASKVKLACAGVGGRNQDSAGTVLCAAPAGQARIVTGRVSNDAGKPVPATLTVTRSSWTINGNGLGYSVKPTSTKTLTAKADGTFSITSNPATRESIKVEVGALPDLGIAAGAFAQAEVQRQVSIVVRKLGGGRVVVTVKGTKPAGLKAQITSADGYAIPGQGAKRLDGHGTATFGLGAQASGKYRVYLVRSALTDLFWASAKPPAFSLSSGR